MSAIGIEIKNIWSKKMLEKKRPLLQVILLESFRPADTASFDSNTVSLTPSFDHIVKNSISFKRAYSYGTVTRGAQEAVFCGYLGSQDTSLMRGRSEIKVTCLPELIKNSSSPGELFWFHGGEGRFDGQLNFWQKHGIKNVMTIDDFTASAPRTGWGIGDGSFFIRAAQELQNLHKISTHPYLVGMLLSVSNHIPWDLPQDAPPNIQNLAVSHPSYRTTAYTDWALGEYISSLKQSGLWSDSIIIIASDHGTTTTPYAGGAFNTTEAELKNHINLALTGGIIEGALSNLQKQSLQIDEWTAQTDISAFIAYLLNTNDIRVMGESLLISDRHLPLIVDLGKNYYLPVLGKTLSQTEALHAPLETFTDPAERVSVIYNRAFLQLLNEWSKKPKRFD
jgi:phosphoglycerol transferase MdoB-like AlkP superfamily enzyme